MTEMQLRKTAGKCASAPRWRRNLFWAIAGAILGILLPALIDYLKPQLWEGFTHARQYLEEGNKLRGEAVREGSEAKHKAANAAFERSWAAGEVEALAQLGIAHCYGWGGYARSWERGHSKLIEAVRLNSNLAPIYFGDPDVCPKAK